MEAQEQERKPVPADLLKKAGQRPSSVQTEAYNPMEDIPTLTVGDDFEEGMVIAGWFSETQVLASHKFKHSQTRNEKGVPTSLRHVLRIGSPTGEKLAIWSCGELRTAFEKIPVGNFISIKYLGKGVNAKGQEQHNFQLERETPAGKPATN